MDVKKVNTLNIIEHKYDMMQNGRLIKGISK